MGGKTTTRRRQSAGVGSLVFPFMTFVVGYLAASVFGINQLTQWVSTNLLARTSTTSVKTAQLQPIDLPKPKFEFYTLLTKEQGGVAEPAAPVTATINPAAKPTMQIAAAVPPSAVPGVVVTKPDAPPIDLTVTQKLPALHPSLATTVAQQPRTMPVAMASGRYMIQVGSFKNSREAEKMKAVLSMRGFTCIMTSMTQQQVTWYRVLIGPFNSLTDAQRVHRDFAQREHITGMIRKLDV